MSRLFVTLALVGLLFGAAVVAQGRMMPIREASVLVPKGSIYYKTIGTGQPILIIHGGPGMDHRYLYPHLVDLARDHRLIFYDQRGTGASQCKLTDKTVNIEQFVRDIDAVRRHLGLNRINILGHSWGGLLGVHYTVRHPLNVRSLMLINSSGLTGESQKEFFDNLDKMRSEEEKEEIKAIDKDPAYIAGDLDLYKRRSELQIKPYFFDLEKLPKLAYEVSPLTVKNNEQVRTWIWRQLLQYDLRPQASRIRAPTFILHSDHDVIPVSVAEETSETIPRSTLVVMKDNGHYSFVEQNKEFLEEVRKFLKTVRGP
ncbi:MAG: alpha/beta fold hydrolase [Leptospirales bacterium]|nr:alpha/beta fold hydrolase [Leptospirales bacterium]